MARELRLPGFRKGKAPLAGDPTLGFGRAGRGVSATRCPMVRAALLDAAVTPIRRSRIDMVSTPEVEGEPLTFKFEVGVRRTAELGEYKGLEVGREGKSRRVGDDTEVERIREGFRAASSRSSAPPKRPTRC